MKKIGLIGGMSWESSLVYYRLINKLVQKKLGGFHSAKCVMESVDFAEIEELQHKNDWKTLNKRMKEAAINLENAQADVIILCTNTMHLCSEIIQENTGIPFIHIAVETGKKIKEKGIRKVLLLGTRFTMETDFYKDILLNEFGIETIVPKKKDRKRIHQIIYDELVHGKIKKTSKRDYIDIIESSDDKGFEGVVLACTEIPLLIQADDVKMPIFDTTRIHAEAAVQFALSS